jgi:hypothetical protein
MLELNRISYAHWSATYRSAGQAGLAHAWARLTVK